MTTRSKVNIRPGVAILGVLRNLNYRAWFALAEFVDNSVQSFLDSRNEIARVDGDGTKLIVDIDLDAGGDGRLVIRDNAAGIHTADLPRAFRPAQIPIDRGGLAEFGMGMKSAACWFSPYWMVRTSALGEHVEREIVFDIGQIVRDELEELDVRERPADPNAHFTEITLTQLYHLPVGRTLGKIKEHLAEIYRVFSREGLLVLRFDRRELAYQLPDVLRAPEYDDSNQPVGDPIEWRKEIEFDFGGGLCAHGFAALREPGSTTLAGFSLFRRKRLVVGSVDEKYRPQRIVGTPNTYQYQRLFGELHLEGFQVAHTKDGFQWDENEEPFLDLLREKLDEPPIRLLRQARNYRSKPPRRELREAAEEANRRTGDAIERGAPGVLPSLRAPEDGSAPRTLPSVEFEARRVIDLTVEASAWRIVLELTNDPAVGDWLSLYDATHGQTGEAGAEDRELLGVRLSLAHPFMERFAGADLEKLEPLLRVAAAIALAEKLARRAGVSKAGAVRVKMNRVLRDAMAAF